MNEKNYTLKGVKAEISRLEKSKQKKSEMVKNLSSEIKEINSKLKELETIFDTLYHENLQKQIEIAWFKENKLTEKQIMKFLELSKQIYDKLDSLDVDSATKAIMSVCNKNQNENQFEVPKTDTEKKEEKNYAINSNFSFSYTGDKK